MFKIAGVTPMPKRAMFDPSQVVVTEDEYGTLYILPGVHFTGNIQADVDQMETDPELGRWLYGELGSDESITDETGQVVYAGADIQDHLTKLPPRPSIASMRQAAGRYPWGPVWNEDAFIKDNPRGGYELIIEGKTLTTSPEWDEVIATFQQWCEDNQYFPQLWFENERGTVDELDSEGNFVEQDDEPDYGETGDIGDDEAFWDAYARQHGSRFGSAHRRTAELDEPVRLYIADLSAYNEGRLVGEWIDLPADEEELQELMDRMTHGGTQDYAIHDYEAPFKIDEYDDPFEINQAIEEIEASYADFDVIVCIKDNLGYDSWSDAISDAEDASVIEASDETELAYAIIDEIYGGIDALPQDTIEMYFDYEKFGRDWSMDIWEDADVEFYEQFSSDAEYGEEIVEQFGDIGSVLGERASNYFDYEKFGRDAAMDYFQCGKYFIRTD